MKHLNKILILSLLCIGFLMCGLSGCKGKPKFSELDSAEKNYHGIPQSELLAIPPDYKLPPPKN